ncbi:hydrogenase maturation nickel metallochaperone HypA [Acidithiobacillus ferrooxidans F221]|jgi:hydrogenase nickel incorporation protein HypA/HybF|uniref:hydrogenase maturation nickel metallochaperone HypA n=1 Tax=Acidithiobacillus ferrooxidans TaxID=920 RepID=UPI001C06C205|nr:hydrogenase maturation nickel metallochaperone HypA [Acidithiobacillus ferrooxidans]MBU2808724.1 hydrogenase maturation nickel metallochaperone HypA [Acidithiobacillus ferrooxidans F221]
MHELSLCEGILQILEEQSRTQGFIRVHRVCLEIGALASVEPEALRFHFDVVMQGTLAEGSRLEFVTVPAQAWCLPCGEKVSIRQYFDDCPQCGSRQLQVIAGEELRIQQLEVE